MINVAAPQPFPVAAPASAPPRPARRVVHCEVVVVDPEESFASDLLPWADPYIASLMASLQREEQQQQRGF